MKLIFLLFLIAISNTLGINPECKICKETIKRVQLKIQNDATQKDINDLERIVSDTCYEVNEVNPGVWGYPVDYDVCEGIADEFTLEVTYILAQSKLSPESICNFKKYCNETKNRHWNININPNKPPIQPPPFVPPNSEKYKILHISDIHFDPLYEPYATTECDEPLCCRKGNKKVYNSTGAGFWGDYRNCDTPIWTYENMLEYISENFDIDIVIYTGDTPGHFVWETTPEGNLEMMNLTYELVRKYLNSSKWYGTIGNHGSSPVNMFPPPNVYTGPNNLNSVQWLYDGLSEIWSESMDENATETFQYGGYFKQRVNDHLIIISLNMNFGDDENWWLLVDSVDPGDMLQWLSDSLQEAEENGDKVFIIGHQHSNYELYEFSKNFYDIIYRYENTVMGQFYGHSHKDEFYVFLDSNNVSRGFSTGYIAGSITPYSFLNFGFRIYDVDVNTSSIVDAHTYIFNLTEANLKGNVPKWYLEYSTKEAYGFKGSTVTNQDWADLSLELETNDELWDKYVKYKYKSYSNENDCYGECRENTICKMRSCYPNSTLFCQ